MAQVVGGLTTPMVGVPHVIDMKGFAIPNTELDREHYDKAI
jgi:hypothetical protein